VAHANVWEGPGVDDFCPWCEDPLRGYWHRLLDQAGAGFIEDDYDSDEQHFSVRGEPLHAGTPLEVLTADGVWLAGRFECQVRPDRQAWFHLALGGWDGPQVVIGLSGDTVVRIPTHDR
jgi:hypothetical protein